MSAPQLPTLEEWLLLPATEIGAWIRRLHHPLLVGLPQDGTRRWYYAYKYDHPDAPDYLPLLIGTQAQLHRMCFEHGIDIVMTPCFAKKNLDRGEKYALYAMTGMLQMLENPIYHELMARGVKIDFYGDYLELLDTPVYRHVLDAILAMRDAAAGGTGPLLLLGFFADEPYETIARLSVEFHRANGRLPTRKDLIRGYFGRDLPDLHIYISYGKARIFSMPLLTTGVESLYTLLHPTPGMTERQLREILYDHLIARRVTEVEYADLSPEGMKSLVDNVKATEGKTQGLGDADPLTGKWQARLT